jgi:acetyl esterase/lipase
MRGSIVVALAALVALWSLLHETAAGPLRDRLMERAEQRRQMTEPRDDRSRAPDELDDDDGPPAPSRWPAGIAVERDLAYGPDAAQRLDVYRPAQAPGGTVGAPARPPLILMVHGGGWRRGDKAMSRVVTHKVSHWVPQGAVLVSVNYRMAGIDPLQEADDVAKALAFAQVHAASWGADPARAVLMGHSAGAHLVALLSADPAIAQRQGAGPWMGTVALDSAAFDVVQIMQSRHFRLYDRAFGREPQLWRQASPLHVMSQAPVPMLLVCSSRRSDSCLQAQDFADKAGSLGGRVSVLPEDLSHSQINEQLGQPGRYTESVDAFFQSLGR